MCKPKHEGGMGFLEMEKFNIALLAKQGWRLLCNTNTVAYSVLKAKNFPDTSVLEYALGNNPSLTWKSIWTSLAIIRQGTRWRRGDGQSVRIWKDKWLPFTPTLMP
ncbi:uncharacterized protein LOC111280644 [Durio zibethinus]|uniref:Uncharacterized protein LOC111280644 n=1 Tax=Durio zibethinus TaxID=66656 RepID=A0A6P5X857_DURZI|nr:uncharacterized protein LOC111280644 [Durio zibethinus]